MGCTNDDLGTYAIEVQNEADGNPKSLARLVNPVQAKFLQPIVGGDAVIGSEFILECQVEPESGADSLNVSLSVRQEGLPTRVCGFPRVV